MTQGKSTQRYLIPDPPEWDTIDDVDDAGAAGAVATATSSQVQNYLEYDSEQDEWVEVHFMSVLTLTTPVLS